MAFEAYLSQEKTNKPRARRVFHAVSIGLHAVLILIAVVYSFWHVEELTPPTVTVTFMSAPPPPPPPPPPPKKKGTKKKPDSTPKEVVQPRPDQIVQPKEEPQPEPEEEEEEDGAEEGGVEGGVKGGVVGGVVGGVIGGTGAAGAPKVVPPNVGEKQAIHKVRPEIPPVLAKSGMLMFNLIKMCVDKGGTVTSVALVKPSDKLFDDACLAALRQWRFTPMSVNGNPVPFCYVQKNILKVGN